MEQSSQQWELTLQAVMILPLVNAEEITQTRYSWLLRNQEKPSFRPTEKIRTNEALSVELNPLNAVFLARDSTCYITFCRTTNKQSLKSTQNTLRRVL